MGVFAGLKKQDKLEEPATLVRLMAGQWGTWATSYCGMPGSRADCGRFRTSDGNTLRASYVVMREAPV